MKDYRQNIEHLGKSDLLSILYEFGYTPNSIRQGVLDSFSEYFQNQDALNKYASSNLIPCWLSLLTVQRDHPSSLGDLRTLLQIFSDAKDMSGEETLEAYVYWQPDLVNSISRFWSLYYSQRNLIELRIEDFLEESLRIIGYGIEGLFKPFLWMLVHMNRIRRKETANVGEIRSTDLGRLIDELINSSELTQIFTMNFRQVKLNQWRNIAYHHNSKVARGQIVCWYRKSNKDEEIVLSRDELYQVVKHVLLLFKLVRIAEVVFVCDNFDRIHEHIAYFSNEINLRDDARLLDFYSVLSGQGFKVIDLKITGDKAELVIQDMQEYGNFERRSLESVRFFYDLWIFSEAKFLKIEYCLFLGQRYMTCHLDGQLFDRAASEKITLGNILASAKYTNSALQFSQKRDPFKGYKISEKMRRVASVFYAQNGDKITIMEFSRQFILSILANYLALKSEGFNKFRINIGSDGSMIVTEGHESNMIFHVPAVIRSKEFQLALIELLNKTISMYESFELRHEIVVEAKDNNNFYLKKSLIRDQLGKNRLDVS